MAKHGFSRYQIIQNHLQFFLTILIQLMIHKLNTTLIFILILTLQLSAQQATLLADIRPGIANGIESDAALVVGGNYFFHGKLS